jgi:hypothetical protein
MREGRGGVGYCNIFIFLHAHNGVATLTFANKLPLMRAEPQTQQLIPSSYGGLLLLLKFIVN